MSEISNSALTPQSWKNYQDRYDQIDWTDWRELKPDRIVLTDDQYQALVKALDEPPRKNPRLERLLTEPGVFDDPLRTTL
jgi:hypothetical protein